MNADQNPPNEPFITPNEDTNNDAGSRIGRLERTEKARIEPINNNILPQQSQQPEQLTTNSQEIIAAQNVLSDSGMVIQPNQQKSDPPTGSLDGPSLSGQYEGFDNVVAQPTVSSNGQLDDSLKQRAAVVGESSNPVNNYFQPSQISGNGYFGSIDNQAVSAQVPIATKKKLNKKVLLAGFGTVAVILMAVVSVLAFYIPNRPQNVWQTGLTRTGDQFSTILTKSNDPVIKQALQKNKISLDGQVSIDDQTYTINLGSQYDKANSNSNLKINGQKANEQKQVNLGIDVKTQLPEKATLPNIYFKLSGIGDLELDSLLPGFSANYDNNWIAIEQDFYRQYQQSIEGAQQKQDNSNVTSDEIIGVLEDINMVNKEYIFTADSQKAVIQLNDFIKTEDSEGIKANHYKASINKDNLQKYCLAMVEKLSVNQTVKKSISSDDNKYNETIKTYKDDCQKSITESKSLDKQFDICVDKKYKLLHKIRIYDDLEAKNTDFKKQKEDCQKQTNDLGLENQTTDFCKSYDDMLETGEVYTDFGQIYKGNDELVIFTAEKADTNKNKYNFKAQLVVNAKKLSLMGNFNGEGSLSSGSTANWKANLNFKNESFDGAITSSKPEGAVPLQQVLDKIPSSRL